MQTSQTRGSTSRRAGVLDASIALKTVSLNAAGRGVRHRFRWAYRPSRSAFGISSLPSFFFSAENEAEQRVMDRRVRLPRDRNCRAEPEDVISKDQFPPILPFPTGSRTSHGKGLFVHTPCHALIQPETPSLSPRSMTRRYPNGSCSRYG